MSPLPARLRPADLESVDFRGLADAEHRPYRATFDLGDFGALVTRLLLGRDLH